MPWKYRHIKDDKKELIEYNVPCFMLYSNKNKTDSA